MRDFSFELQASDGRARAAVFHTPHGPLATPVFAPVGTQATVKAVTPRDLSKLGATLVLANTYHLMLRPGDELIARQGGLHTFMGWDGPILTDSGGFQIFSLMHRGSSEGAVSQHGFSFSLGNEKRRRKLTPETSIHRQLRLGSDILFCLDHCTHPDSDNTVQRESVNNTVRWAKMCKEAFEKIVKNLDGGRPLLFAVVQGGESRELRRECAERLFEIGFDGYGYGGWPVDAEGRLLPSVEYTAQLIPSGVPKHALGIGKPETLVEAFRIGYELFDCVIPTRDARHRRLYVFPQDPLTVDLGVPKFYVNVYMEDEKHARGGRPVSETCDCACCSHYTRAYLHHLFKIGDPLASRLATIHNLRFYVRLIERLRKM